jgi:hypothetical protein
MAIEQPKWLMVVKLELINEEGEKVSRQMRFIITTGVELWKAKFILDKEDINVNSKKPGGIHSSCHVNMKSLYRPTSIAALFCLKNWRDSSTKFHISEVVLIADGRWP